MSRKLKRGIVPSRQKPAGVDQACMPRVKEDGILRALVGPQVWGLDGEEGEGKAKGKTRSSQRSD